jgi:hypothetical protein
MDCGFTVTGLSCEATMAPTTPANMKNMIAPASITPSIEASKYLKKLFMELNISKFTDGNITKRPRTEQETVKNKLLLLAALRCQYE